MIFGVFSGYYLEILAAGTWSRSKYSFEVDVNWCLQAEYYATILTTWTDKGFRQILGNRFDPLLR